MRILNKYNNQRGKITLNSKKKINPKEEKKLQMVISFLNQNKINPRSGQLVNQKESSVDICTVQDLR